MRNWFLGILIPALLRWGHLIFEAVSAPFVLPIVRKRLKETEAALEDATERIDTAHSEVSYWKSDDELWRGRYAELELTQRQQQSTPTARRKPPSSTN